MNKNINPLIVLIILGVLGLTIFIMLFDQSSPTASIEINLSKEDALKKSDTFVKQAGFDLKGYDKTVIFHSDYEASVYLQKTQGIKISNELIRKGIPVWFWRVRYFKELQKKGFMVDIDPSTGQLIQFYYSLLEDEKGASLAEAAARELAEKEIASQEINLSDYILKDSTIKTRKHRLDYHFEWEKRDYKIEEATLRLKVHIYGDELGRFNRYLKVPEEFSRYLNRETSLGLALTMISNILMFIITIVAVFLLITKSREIKAKWKWGFGVIFASILIPLEIIYFLNRLSLYWISYPDTISKLLFFMIIFQKNFVFACSVGIMVFAYGTVGYLLSRDLWKTKTPLLDAAKNKIPFNQEIATVFVVGYSMAFIFLGYITIFYLLGTKFFDIWMPPESEYSNIFGTYLPFLFPLTIAISAAIREEFMYRLFAISFLKKYTKLTWLAVFVPSLVWGFAHSNYAIYPNYVRGIELTLFGIALSLVFLKYGLEAAIIAHFVINASLAGLPLIKSHNPYFAISGIIVILLALSPVPIAFIKFKKQSFRHSNNN